MQIELRGSGFELLAYWRTALLVPCAGGFLWAASKDELAVILGCLACAFLFSGYERRRWIVVPAHFNAGDIILRVSLALAVAGLVRTFL